MALVLKYFDIIGPCNFKGHHECALSQVYIHPSWCDLRCCKDIKRPTTNQSLLKDQVEPSLTFQHAICSCDPACWITASVPTVDSIISAAHTYVVTWHLSRGYEAFPDIIYVTCHELLRWLQLAVICQRVDQSNHPQQPLLPTTSTDRPFSLYRSIYFGCKWSPLQIL